MFTDTYRGRRVSYFMCTYALTRSLFMFLSYGVLVYLQKFNPTFFQKGCVCQKWLFFSNESKFCCNEISFFYLNLLFQTNVSQNGFNFHQTESLVYPKFSVTPSFEKILCSLARAFISEVILHRYLQALFYTITIIVVTVT